MKGGIRTYPLLAPLSFLYREAMAARNFCYDRGILPVSTFDFPVISVGNITVGGTGKTPHVQYLIELLGANGELAVLSRGYGRITKGFILAGDNASANAIGDEPMQIHTKFPGIAMAVDEKRAHGIRLLAEHGINTVILDDAFQHRSVKPSLNILLVDWSRNILDDMVMPAGRLRESASGRRRADVIIFTKCPAELDNDSMDRAASEIAVRPDQRVFFSTFSYGCLRPMSCATGMPDLTRVLALTGIARPQPMVNHLRESASQVELLQFPDHHKFSRNDMEKIRQSAGSIGEQTAIVTTEKDEARLRGIELPAELERRMFVLPVKVSFLREQEQFNSMILKHVKSFSI